MVFDLDHLGKVGALYTPFPACQAQAPYSTCMQFLFPVNQTTYLA